MISHLLRYTLLNKNKLSNIIMTESTFCVIFKPICSGFSISNLGIELSQKVKVLLEVCGQYRLNDKEAKTLEFHMIKVGQEVVLWLRQVETPGRRSMMVL